MGSSWKNKLVGALAAGAIVAGLLPVTALGATGALEADTKISVTGVEDGATVRAYQVVKVDQSNTADNGTAGWALAGTFGDIELNDIIGTGATIDASEAATIANAAPSASPALETVTLSQSSAGGAYEADVTKPGLYVVVVTGTGATVYNPMFVSADYSQDNPNTNTIAASETYSGNTAVAKSSTPTLTKSADQATDKAVQAGDSVEFTIGTQVPYYPSPYYDANSVKFEINDVLDDGLAMPTAKADVVVKAGNDTLDEGTDYDLTLNATNRSLKIEFKASYLQDVERQNKGGLTNGTTAVTVKYAATVGDVTKFTQSVQELTNDASITFTNKPGTGTDATHTPPHKKTHHYTFGVDANLAGSSSGQEKTKELRKIAVDADGNVKYESIETSFTDTGKQRGPLEGATFELKGTSSDGTTYSQTTTTDENGRISFTGLDADIVYTMKETSAPLGYQLDTTQYQIKVVAEYNEPTENEDATLKSYKVKFKKAADSDWQDLTTYTIENENGEIKTTVVDNGSVTALIKNVKAGLLPSTGGSGIFFYLAVGGAIAGISLYLMKKDEHAEAAE